MEELCSVIEQTGTVTSLTLTNAGIRDDLLVRLATTVKSTTPVSDLRSVDLSNNFIGAGAIKPLLDIVGSKPDLKKLRYETHQHVNVYNSGFSIS